ncbi:FGGY family carbohydrate kinase [Flavobacteriaceae bacterium 3-367]
MYFIGYDIGSSSVKTALVEIHSGKAVAVVAEPKKEMEIRAVKNGWAEQDPEDWWIHVCRGTQSLLSRYNIASQDIHGIGISYQMHGLVLVDNIGKPLRDSIIWCDSRAVEIGEKAFEEMGAEKCTAQLLNSPANFTASKLKWVKENEPEIFDKIHRCMLPGDYIAYKLSGDIATTIPGLSEGIFWDFSTKDTAGWLLEHYGLHRKLLPPLVKTFSVQAQVSKKGATASGLAVGTPILYRAGDQPNNALSLNIFQPGEIAATGGTSGVMYAVTDNLSVKESERVNNFAHVNYSAQNPRIGKLLCINGAGIQYRWLMNNLKVSGYDQMNTLAASVPVGSDGVTLHPFGNGAERMLNNRNLGTRIGHLNLNNHNKAHLCRAALEGIAFSFVYGAEILKSDGIKPRVIRAGNDNLFRSDIFSSTIATLIGHDIEIYNTTGAIGAARACTLHAGDYKSFGEQLAQHDYVRSFTPLNDAAEYHTAYRKWKNELESILKNT